MDALLEIGDRSVVGEIEKYLEGTIPNESRSAARRVLIQLKETDPVTGPLGLLEEDADEIRKGDIIGDLSRYKNPTVVIKLKDIAAISDSAFLRREAIWGLKTVGNRPALLA